MEENRGKLIPIDIEQELKKSFISYAIDRKSVV